MSSFSKLLNNRLQKQLKKLLRRQPNNLLPSLSHSKPNNLLPSLSHSKPNNLFVNNPSLNRSLNNRPNRPNLIQLPKPLFSKSSKPNNLLQMAAPVMQLFVL